MTIYVGGIRDRLIHESVFQTVKTGLTYIGWFNAGRAHAPLNLIPEQKDWDEELPYNTITVAPGGQMSEDWELGNFGSKTTTSFYIEVYGENEALGNQISGDIRDILQGKFSALTSVPGQLRVLDYTQATPPVAFVCDVAHVLRDRATDFPHKFQRYLYMVHLAVVDWYDTDADPNYPAIT